MKLKSLITLSLMLALSFSIIHEYAFTFYDDEHCNTAEYVQEFQGPNLHNNYPDSRNDLCDVHYGYHHPCILSQYDILSHIGTTNFFTIPKDDLYHFKNYSKTIKPPIA